MELRYTSWVRLKKIKDFPKKYKTMSLQQLENLIISTIITK